MKTKRFWVIGILLMAIGATVLTVCTTYEQDRIVPTSAVDVQITPSYAIPGYEDQCVYKARVAYLDYEGGLKPHLILKEEGTILLPLFIESEFELLDGQFVFVGFEKAYNQGGESVMGIPVKVLCIRLRDPDLDELPADECVDKGRIVDLGTAYSPYNINIKLKDGTLLYAMEMKTEFKMKVGQFVALGYERTFQPVNVEIKGISVIVTCMRLRNPDPDEDLKLVDYNDPR